MSWHKDGSHCDTPAKCAALANRRQRAREAAQDECPSPYVVRDASDDIDAAIQVATQVTITQNVKDTANVAYLRAETMTAVLVAAFRAAGFEVVE